MTESEALRAIARIVDETLTQLEEVRVRSGREEPRLDEYVEASRAGVLQPTLSGPGWEALVSAVEVLCEELVATRLVAILPTEIEP